MTDQIQRDDVQRLALQGWGEVRIARTLGLGRGLTRTTLRWLRNWGRIPRRSCGGVKLPTAETRDERARDLRRAGHTLAEICEELGCGTGTVARAVKGIPTDGRRRRTAALTERRGDVRRLSEQGHTTAEIADDLGVKTHAVREDIRAMTTDDRHNDRRIQRSERVAASHMLAVAGATPKEIAVELGVTARTVRLYLGPAGRKVHKTTRALSALGAAYRKRIAIGMRDSGKKHAAIATRLGVSVKSVPHLLRGAPARPRHTQQPDVD